MKKQAIAKQIFSVIFFFLSAFLFTGCNDKSERPTRPGEDYREAVNVPDTYVVPEAEDVVIYSINPRVFAEQNALNVITERLDDIKALGTNVIWLMPLYAQGEGPRNVKDGRGSPYCIRDYKAINSEYGTVEDLRRLVSEAHRRGMAVIMDWVANHTSWDNAWIENEGWYVKDAAADTIIHPPGTDWTDVAQLNFNNADMRAAMIDAMKFWFTEANIDGFRCDAVDHVPFDFWEEAVPELRKANEGRRTLMFAEGNKRNYLTAGFDMDFGWNFYERLKNLYAERIPIATFFRSAASEVNSGRKQIRFTTNHDKSAWELTDVAQFNGERGAMAAFVITATLGGMPMIYSTQEIGREETVPFFSCTTINWNSNPAITNEYKDIMKAYTLSNVFTRGTVESYPLDDVVCFTKTKDDKKAMVAANVRNNNVTFSVPEALQGEWKNTMDNSTVTLSETVEMTPYQYYILEK